MEGAPFVVLCVCNLGVGETDVKGMDCLEILAVQILLGVCCGMPEGKRRDEREMKKKGRN